MPPPPSGTDASESAGGETPYISSDAVHTGLTIPEQSEPKGNVKYLTINPSPFDEQWQTVIHFELLSNTTSG